MSHLKTYSTDDIQAAKAGPHRTWDTYDMQNEGVRMHTLHTLVSADDFDATEAKAVLGELTALSQSYGYASCDSLLFDLGQRTRADLEDETVMQIRFDELFDNHEEDGYFFDANTSEKTLWHAAKSEEAKNFLKGDHISYNGYNGILSSSMSEAFVRGRDMKALQAGRADLVSQNSAAKITP
jgi:hypothetical protein